MSLPQTGSAEDEQRVERGLARGCGDVLSGGEPHLVALPFHNAVEVVCRVQSRVDADLVYAGIYKRVGFVRRRSDHVYWRIRRIGCHPSVHLHGRLS